MIESRLLPDPYVLIPMPINLIPCQDSTSALFDSGGLVPAHRRMIGRQVDGQHFAIRHSLPKNGARVADVRREHLSPGDVDRDRGGAAHAVVDTGVEAQHVVDFEMGLSGWGRMPRCE